MPGSRSLKYSVERKMKVIITTITVIIAIVLSFSYRKFLQSKEGYVCFLKVKVGISLLEYMVKFYWEQRIKYFQIILNSNF